MNKSQKIRVLLAEGVSVADIAKKVKCTEQLVYSVRSQWRKGAKKRFSIVLTKRENEIVKYDENAPDVVDHPPHYTVGGIETIDFIEAKKLGYHLGNVVKYISRVDQKDDPVENLKKARWYLDREISKRQDSVA